MKTAIKCTILVILALVLPGTGWSSCSTSERLTASDAACLAASHRNYPGGLYNNTWSVENECSEFGLVVAKIELQNSTDVVRILTDDSTNSGETRARIQGTYCCTDLSELCNKSDMTGDSCVARFEASDAGAGCGRVTATIDGSYMCTINARCNLSVGTTGMRTPVTKTFAWADVGHLTICVSGGVTDVRHRDDC